MKLEYDIYGGELARLLKNHEALAQAAKVAATAREEAVVALSAAKADDQRAAVSAKIAGKAVPQRTREEKAEIAVREAEYNATITTQAAKAVQDQVVEEATRNPEYVVALAAREESETKAAINALDALENLLGEIAVTRAYLAWLKSPTRADEIVEEIDVDDVWQNSSAKRPNGESARTSDLVVPVREALTEADLMAERKEDLRRHGLPVGAVLAGPWGPVAPTPDYQRRMSEASARLFEEEAKEAAEAQAVLAGEPT